MLGQKNAQVLGDIAHICKVGHAAHIEPMPELRDAHLDLLWRHADLEQLLGHFFTRHADERRLLLHICAHMAGKLVARIING